MDDAFRGNVAGDLAHRDAELRNSILAGLSGPFDGAIVHVYTQTDTSLISYITAVEREGEVVLLAMHSIAYFERPEIVERRFALFNALVNAWDPRRFGSQWTEETFGTAAEAVRAYADGARSGRYPGWAYENRRGLISVGQTVIPDWFAVTVTSIQNCPPRYPRDGWAILFICPDG
ncbi:hypothetical protein [Hasllibacter sp. MH4015]|uniref:hypothetical protein n=1 Tax=Hasllibacter sp. MH4015 TaxID=2854029 RepID=UPI001CD27217|nr:hypothetical protein [Hasllibacter sp. MH4015]